MKTFLAICGAALLLILGGCSIQVSGLNNNYQTPQDTSFGALAKLSLATDNASISTIDGKSTRQQSLELSPGQHSITLYVNKRDDRSKIAHLLVLSARFKAHKMYLIKSQGKIAWIEDRKGVKVSQVVSSMTTTKVLSF